MNYTEKYHLPQWEETDRIMRGDFNQMCADLEGGIARAQAAADTARSEAAEAAVLPYIVGSYTGNGETIQVDIGFSPRFIIITTQQPAYQDAWMQILVAAGRRNLTRMIGYFSHGFTVTEHTENPGISKTYPRLNTSGTVYYFIAFR